MKGQDIEINKKGIACSHFGKKVIKRIARF